MPPVNENRQNFCGIKVPDPCQDPVPAALRDVAYARYVGRLPARLRSRCGLSQQQDAFPVHIAARPPKHVPLLVTVEEADTFYIQVSQQQERRNRPSTEPCNPIPNRDGLGSSAKKTAKNAVRF